MEKRTMIDAHVAHDVAAAVEHLTDLNNAMKDIRWCLVRGEFDAMPIWTAKKATNALKGTLASLEYSIKQATKANSEDP
jgi:hypothetical protein